jgi:hypothetical protein
MFSHSSSLHVNKNNAIACVLYRHGVLPEDDPDGVETCGSFSGFGVLVT